jgi:hypothetical protein
VSEVEVLSFLRKSLGIIIKRLEETGVLSAPSYTDHAFVPELEVSDAGVELPVSGTLYKVAVVGDYPVYVNVDRPVGGEYKVVWPGSYALIPRVGRRLFLKAPQGFRTRVAVEVYTI